MKLFGNSHSKKSSFSAHSVSQDHEDPMEDVNFSDDDDLDDSFDDTDELPLDDSQSSEDPVSFDTDQEDEEAQSFQTKLSGVSSFFKNMSSRKIMVLSAVCSLVIVLAAAALFVNYFLNLINYQAANSDYFATVGAGEALPEESPINSKLAAMDEAEAASSLEATPEELAQWNRQIENVVSGDGSYEVPISEDVYNILLIGSDTRESGAVGRSDAMILVSINQKTETIYLTSFLRDCYVHIPDYGNTRLNHAFAYGGPALLEETLEENFKVHVDRYVAVDFYSFMDVIDILGGVWINVTEEEQEITNDYIWSMNNLMGEEWSEDYLWSSGWQLLNGKQALCYARNRYTGNDYERTQRQRTIINQIINGAMEASPSTLVSLAQVILPQITTDLEKSEILSYAANIGAYLDYDVVSQQIPAADTYSSAMIDGMSVIRLDLDENIEYLQGTIYAGTEYGFPIPDTQDASDYGATGYTEDEEDEDRETNGTKSPYPSASPSSSPKPSLNVSPSSSPSNR